MTEVQRTLTINADPARVWEEILDGDWLGDETSLTPVAGADGFVADGDDIRHLIVESVTPGERLTFRWWALTDDGVGAASRVTVTVEHAAAEEPADAVATQVVVVETPLPHSTALPSDGPLALAAA